MDSPDLCHHKAPAPMVSRSSVKRRANKRPALEYRSMKTLPQALLSIAFSVALDSNEMDSLSLMQSGADHLTITWKGLSGKVKQSLPINLYETVSLSSI